MPTENPFALVDAQHFEGTRFSLERLPLVPELIAGGPWETGYSRRFVWQPGDGTRYEFTVVFGARRIFGWLNGPRGGVCAEVHADSVPHPNYISEKMSVRHDYEAPLFALFIAMLVAQEG